MSNEPRQRNFFTRPSFNILHLGLIAIILGAFFFWVSGKRTEEIRREAFQSPLPNIKVLEGPAEFHGKAYGKPYKFTEVFFPINIPIWQKVFEKYRDQPNVTYLEVGVYEGGSLMWMLENILTHPTARVTALDLFWEPWKDLFLANLELSGSKNKVQVIAGRSQIELRKLPLESFDIIYVDGSHEKGDVLEDAVLCFRLLKDGGLLIFDDYEFFGPEVKEAGLVSRMPKPAIDAFIHCLGSRLDVLHSSSQVILQKKAPPAK